MRPPHPSRVTDVTGPPQPHRDQRTIGSFKRTCNAALLLWIANRTAQPASSHPLRPSRLLIGAALAAVLVHFGIAPSSLPTLP